MRRQDGVSLLELLVVLAIIGLMAAIAGSDLFQVQRSVNLRRLAKQIDYDTRLCHVEALTTFRSVGLIFYQEHAKWLYRMIVDGNSNGLSRHDFEKGIDMPIGPRVWLEFLSAGTHVGVPTEWQVPDPSGEGTLPGDGLRLGRSEIISFSARGTATPCSIYFNDGVGRMLAVRINGEIGKIRALEWRRGWKKWQEVVL
jgi:prepilin-type N-terminal cleavage/methylation domain-containing protein